MPREVVIQLWCDPCDQAGEKVLAVGTWTVGVVQAEVSPGLHAVDVCEVHNKEMDQWFAMVNASPPFVRPDKPAVTSPAKPSKPADSFVYPCPVCGLESSSLSGRISHVWNVHRGGRPPVPEVCPECGVGQPTAQGMSAHRRSTHQYDALADALSGVKGYRPGKAI